MQHGSQIDADCQLGYHEALPTRAEALSLYQGLMIGGRATRHVIDIQREYGVEKTERRCSGFVFPFLLQPTCFSDFSTAFPFGRAALPCCTGLLSVERQEDNNGFPVLDASQATL